MKTLKDFNFKGKKVLVRVDLNVPLDDHRQVTDRTRIKATVPTVKHILDQGGKVILMSHLGRPKGQVKEEFSLRHLTEELSNAYGAGVKFVPDCIGSKAENAAAEMHEGDVLLLENVRFHKEETDGDQDFAKKLAKLGDIYINDAFGTAHRAHASTTIVAQFFKEKGSGYIMAQELENADKVLGGGKRPLTALMGGAKVSDKLQIIERLMEKVDNLLIGGGMSYTFSKAKGGQIGNSLFEEDKVDLVKSLMEKAEKNKVNLVLPQDTLCADDFNNDANTQIVDAGQIPDDWEGLDIGPKTVEQFRQILNESNTILWNGPMGVFEMDTFAKGTNAIAEAVVEATQRGAFTLIGGGDSASAINKAGYYDQVSWVSTGGGALLEHIEGHQLPGIAALEG